MTKKDRREKAERRLAKAQLDLHLAQEKRTRAMAKGERDVEKARRQAAERVSRSTERVERAAGRLARAEARLAVITGPPRRRQRRTATRAFDTSSLVDDSSVVDNPSVLITPEGIPLPVPEVPPEIEEEEEAGAPIVSVVQITGQDDILSEELGTQDGDSTTQLPEGFRRRAYGTRRRTSPAGDMTDAQPEDLQGNNGATDTQ